MIYTYREQTKQMICYQRNWIIIWKGDLRDRILWIRHRRYVRVVCQENNHCFIKRLYCNNFDKETNSSGSFQYTDKVIITVWMYGFLLTKKVNSFALYQIATIIHKYVEYLYLNEVDALLLSAYVSKAIIYRVFLIY